MRASRNARKHGLTISIRRNPGISNEIEALAVAIAGKSATPCRLQAARGVAEAYFELRRLQESKLALIGVEMASMHAGQTAASSGNRQHASDRCTIEHDAQAYTRALPVLVKLDRYERRALSKQRRAYHIYLIANEE
jgi:hypothetical protein